MKEYYERLYHDRKAYHWDAIRGRDTVYIQHTRKILKLVNEFGHGKIIDIGCGDGYITSQVFTKFKETVGEDISKEAILIAKKKILEMPFVVATCTNLPFLENLFDTIVASEIIEHVSYADAKKLLTGARRILTPHGRIILSTPNFSNPYMKFLHLTRRNIEHLEEYNRKEFAELVSSHFEIIHLDSDVSLPIFVPLIKKFVKIPNCYNYCVAEKV